MNELLKYLKQKGLGDLAIGVIIIGGVTFAYHQFLQIKHLQTRIFIDEHTKKEILSQKAQTT